MSIVISFLCIENPMKRCRSPQPEVRSILKNATANTNSFALKNGVLPHVATVDPFSRLCQMQTAGNNHMKIVGDDSSMQYILGLRAVARDVFHDEIGNISKAIYDEVVFRVSSVTKEKNVSYNQSMALQQSDLNQIEQAITNSLSFQKSSFIDPLTQQISDIEKKSQTADEKMVKFEEALESLQTSNFMDHNSEDSSFKNEEMENMQTEIETIKNEFAERGNLYIRLCEELESDRLDNKLMKDELESEFNLIQQQFETFEKNTQENMSVQINENIDFFVENFKNDVKNLRNEIEQDKEDEETFFKRKTEDLKKRIEAIDEEADERLTRTIKEMSARHQSLVEKVEIDTAEVRSKIKKVENKLEGTPKSSVSKTGKLMSYIEGDKHLKTSSLEIESSMVGSIMHADTPDSKHGAGGLISYMKYEEINEDLKSLREAYETTTDEVSIIKGSLENLHAQADNFRDISAQIHKIKSDTNDVNNSIDHSKFTIV
jgi:hypothetical protein